MKHSAQLVTLSAQRLAYGSMFNFPESRNALSKVQSAKLNTDVTILMPSTDYFGETALEQDITYLSTSCGSLQHHAEITQPHTFVALVQAYIVT